MLFWESIGINVAHSVILALLDMCMHTCICVWLLIHSCIFAFMFADMRQLIPLD